MKLRYSAEFYDCYANFKPYSLPDYIQEIIHSIKSTKIICRDVGPYYRDVLIKIPFNGEKEMLAFKLRYGEHHLIDYKIK